MRCSKSRIFAVVSGALLAVAAAAAAFADDTEIFFNQNAADIPANVLFIMDTSGSMNELVTTPVSVRPGQDLHGRQVRRRDLRLQLLLLQ